MILTWEHLPFLLFPPQALHVEFLHSLNCLTDQTVFTRGQLCLQIKPIRANQSVWSGETEFKQAAGCTGLSNSSSQQCCSSSCRSTLTPRCRFLPGQVAMLPQQMAISTETGCPWLSFIGLFFAYAPFTSVCSTKLKFRFAGAHGILWLSRSSALEG